MVYMEAGKDYDDAADAFKTAVREERLTRVRIALEAQAQGALLPMHRAVLANATLEEREAAASVLAQQKNQADRVGTTLRGISLDS